MQKIVVFILIATNTLTYPMDFVNRFGPNSPAYNAPIYFSARHMLARPHNRVKNKKKGTFSRKLPTSLKKRTVKPTTDFDDGQ